MVIKQNMFSQLGYKLTSKSVLIKIVKKILLMLQNTDLITKCSMNLQINFPDKYYLQIWFTKFFFVW